MSSSRGLAGLVPFALSIVVALAGGCARTGMGASVRDDVIDRMSSVRAPIAGCYEAALTRNRKLRGTMEVSLVTEPGTGQFKDVQVVRDDLGDAELSACVVEQVSGLKLAEPQKTKLSLSYPFEFNPAP